VTVGSLKQILRPGCGLVGLVGGGGAVSRALPDRLHVISLTFTYVAIMASEYLTALDGAYTTLHSLPDSKSLQALSPELMLQQAQLVISDLDSLSWIQIVLCTTVVYCLQLVRKRIHQIIYHIDYFHDHMLKSDCSGCRGPWGPWGPYAPPRDLFCI
jgi:hypothetical protein